MEGPLPFTPRFEFKLNGNYTIPMIEVDLGVRFRLHTGRPVWVLQELGDRITERTDLTDTDFLAHAVLVTGGTQIVAQDPMKPLYMPVLKILDLRLEKAFSLGAGRSAPYTRRLQCLQFPRCDQCLYQENRRGRPDRPDHRHRGSPQVPGRHHVRVLARDTSRKGECPALPLFFMKVTPPSIHPTRGFDHGPEFG